MSHLILSTNFSAGRCLELSNLANAAVGIDLRLVAGPLPSQETLAARFEPRSSGHAEFGSHWLDIPSARRSEQGPNIGLFELCEKFDSIDIWVDVTPNDQLVLLLLLNIFRPYKEITTKLSLIHADGGIAGCPPEDLAQWKLPIFKLTEKHFALAGRAWEAWRAPTPERWFDLLMTDLMLLPGLRRTVIALLEELPDHLTGLGASEMNMLENIEEFDQPSVAVLGGTRSEVFNEDEAADLLDELAQCAVPIILGMGEGPFNKSPESRYARYQRSKIALTSLGRAVLEREEDFSRRNVIHRWWGGTELTNDRLWRWHAGTRRLVAP